MIEPRIGSVCSGYEGLGMAVQSVLGGELAWVADNDAGAAKILAHRYPSAPNLGDIKIAKWEQVEIVDIFIAGFPCQPVSQSGQRKGIDDDRWLFEDLLSALRRLGSLPRLLVFENVRGLLTANRGDAMARVVEGLAALGYVGSWRLVRACDVGAPHGRPRVFIVAGHADGLAWASEIARSRRSAALDEPGQIERAVGPDRVSPLHWGPVRPAIRHWERVLGRAAPHPRELGADGKHRLSPRFVEWEQGLPVGHVTDVPGLSPEEMLHALGNGVVPQQAAYGIESQLGLIGVEVAA